MSSPDSGVERKPERFSQVPDISGFTWLILEGISYERADGKMQGQFVYDPSQRKDSSFRLKEKTYNIYDGVIVVIFRGKTYAAPTSPQREEAVRKANYRQELILFPSLLSSEQIVDEEIRKRFAQL